MASWLDASSLSAARWTDVSGEKTIEADFVGVLGEQVILELPSGKRSAIALRNLQYESRQQALELEQTRQEHMSSVAGELKRAVEKELEAGPKQVAPPEVTVAPYQPLPDNASLETAARHAAEQVQAGHLRAVWDGLPPSYQADVEQVVSEFARQMDPAVWQDSLGLLQRLTELLASRERWIFAYPPLQDSGNDPSTREAYRAFLGLVQTLFDPETLTLERLQQGNLEAWIAERDAQLAPFLVQLESLNSGGSPLDPSRIKIEMIDENRGTVLMPLDGATAAAGRGTPRGAGGPAAMGSAQMEMGSAEMGMGSAEMGMGSAEMGMGSAAGARRPAGGPPSQVFVRVEGHWVPETMAKQWDQRIAEVRKTIQEQLPSRVAEIRPLVAMAQQTVDQYLRPLETAGSEAEFHAELGQLAGQAAGMAMAAFAGMNRGEGRSGGPFGSSMGSPTGPAAMEGGAMGEGYGSPGYGSGNFGDPGGVPSSGSMMQESGGGSRPPGASVPSSAEMMEDRGSN